MSLLPRIIPALLLRGSGLVKTEQFKKPVYLGDPINIIRIFNDKEVDEIALLDIEATRDKRGPNFKKLAEITDECFMPLGYGGGITSIGEIKQLFAMGVEKVILNSIAAANPGFVREAADQYGSQSVVVSIDVKQRALGRSRVFSDGGTLDTGEEPVAYAAKMQKLGAGELLLTSIDRDGTMRGYDLPLIRSIAGAVDIPVIACGGARGLDDFRRAVLEAGASAVAAGSVFVFQGVHRAVLISFPSRQEIEETFLEGVQKGVV